MAGYKLKLERFCDSEVPTEPFLCVVVRIVGYLFLKRRFFVAFLGYCGRNVLVNEICDSISDCTFMSTIRNHTA